MVFLRFDFSIYIMCGACRYRVNLIPEIFVTGKIISLQTEISLKIDEVFLAAEKIHKACEKEELFRSAVLEDEMLTRLNRVTDSMKTLIHSRLASSFEHYRLTLSERLSL